MNILLLEDESLVAKNLEKLVRQLLPDATLHGPLVSVEASMRWLKQHPEPDLILSDIQLADGVSFDIFQELTRSFGQTIIAVTHDDDFARKSDRIIEMKDGIIIS